MAKNHKYFYNPKTLRYEKVKYNSKENIFRYTTLSLVVILLVSICSYGVYKIFPSPETKKLEREIAQMESKYLTLNNKLDMVGKVVSNVKERDESVYMTLFGIEPIDDGLWNGGVGGHDPYSDIISYSNSSELIKLTQRKLSDIERKLVLQSKSIEEIEDFAIGREERLSSIPSIKPVERTKLDADIQLLSGFGMRMHPIHKVKKMHAGIDFSCAHGTAVYATGDGKVVKVRNSKSGYGKHVVIDHGYGYKTLYGHMQKYMVKKGDEVKKGEKIGEVGSTGTSTSAHLHYEVHKDDKPVNPINYVMDGLSPTEYAELVKLSEMANQSFD